MSDAFQEWLGDDMARHLQEAKFTLLPPEHPLQNVIAYDYVQSVLMTNVVADPEEREAIIQHYLSFFEEIVEKLLIEAMQLRPNLELGEDFTNQVLDMLRMYLNKILSGDPLYLPYLMEVEPKTPQEFQKGVQVFLRLFLDHKDDPHPTIPWHVATEYWEIDPHDPELMNKILNLEISTDLLKD